MAYKESRRLHQPKLCVNKKHDDDINTSKSPENDHDSTGKNVMTVFLTSVFK